MRYFYFLFFCFFLFENFAQTPTTVTLTTVGAGTWTVPANVYFLDVQCVGGGGGGGGVSVGNGAGGGGGGGAFSRTSNLSVSPSQNISYTIGAGGLGGAAVGANGSSGISTWFLSNTTILAEGGIFGSGGNSGGFPGGVGGNSINGFGSIKWSGGNGGNGIGGSSSGGGGGGAGTTANGGAGAAPAGGAGVAPGGAGGAGSATIGTAGLAGAIYGGGGGGGRGGTQIGGNGAQGVIIISYVVCPQITQQPFSASICQGSSANFSVTATGSGITYQWQLSTDGGSTWSNLNNGANYSGAATSNLSVSGVVSGINGYQYQCVLSNGCGMNIISNPATLTVNPFPVFTGPFSDTTCSGNSVNYTISANPSAGTAYSWYAFSNSNVSGESTTSINGNVINDVLVNTGLNNQIVTYNITMTTGAGCVGTQTINISVAPVPSFNLSANPGIICPGDSSTLHAGQLNLDVSQTTITNISRWMIGNTGWQSFKVTQNGKLTKLRIRTVTYSTNANVIVRVYSGNPGSGTLLSTFSYSKPTNIDSWDDIIFPNGGPTVFANSNYYIEIPAGAAIDWPYATTDPYGNGQAWYGVTPSVIPAEDFNFETYIDPNIYNWNPGSLTGSIVTVSPTSFLTYTATATNTSGCVATNTVIVDVYSAAVGGTANSNQTICTGSIPASITLTGYSGSIQWQESSDNINWTNISGATQPTLASATLGALNATKYYRANVSNGSCTSASSSTVTITVNPYPTVVASNSGPFCTGQTISLTANGGGTYSWTGPNTFSSTIQNPNISNSTVSMAGTYTVTVNLNGCVGTMTTNVIVNSTPTVTATNTGPYCPGQTISLATSTGGTYSWSGPNAFASTTQNPTLSGATTAMGGAYTVTLTANSCTASASTIVVVNSNNSITLSSAPGTDNQAVCVGSAITSITYATSGATGASFSGLPAGVTGSWSTNVATISGTPTASGTFNYTVTMSGGCTGGTNTASGSVIVNPVLTASVSVVPSTTLICAGSSATFTATPTNGGPTPAYQWKVNGINTGTNSSVFTSASLVNNDVITVVMTSNAAPCLSGSPVTSNPITMTVNPLTTILSQSTSAQAVCLNSSFNPLTVTASGNNITYQWYSNSIASSSGGILISGVVSPSYTPLSSAVGSTYYYCIVNGTCGSDTSVVSGAMQVDDLTVIASQTLTTQTVCQLDSMTSLSVLSSGTGLSYSWFSNMLQGYSGANFISGAVNSNYIPSSSVAGTSYYYCIVTGTCGSDTSQISGAQIVNPLATLALVSLPGSNAQTVCENNSISPITYVFSGAAGVSVVGLPNGIIANTTTDSVLISGSSNMPGNYTFSVSTSGSCGSSFETGNITVTTNPFGTTTVTNVSCFGAANGAADLTPSGGTAPYTFSWSNNATTEDISSVSAGNYFVTITDANGCNSTDSVTITEPVSGIVTAIQGTNVLCFGNSSGAADLTVSGGSLPYTFLWSNNALTEDISSISSGSYTVTVTDNNSCTAIDSITISQPASPVNALVSITPSTLTACQGDSIVFTAIPTNGGISPIYQWQINGVSVGSNNDSLVVGSLSSTDSVSVILTSNEICVVNSNVVSQSAAVTINPLPSILSESLTFQSVCLGDTFQLIIVTASGTGNNYQWYSNSNSIYSGATSISGANSSAYQPASGIPGVLYYYCVLSNGCGTDTSSLSGAFTVNASGPPSVTIASTDTLICSGSSAAFSSNAVNSGSTPTYQWLLNGSVISGATLSNYSTTTLQNNDVISLSVLPGAGACGTTSINSNSITINVITTPTITATSGSPYCENDSIQLSTQSNGTVTWSGPNSYTSSGNNVSIGGAVLNMSGLYIATAVSGNCSGTDTISILVNPVPFADAGVDLNFGCLASTITINGSTNLGNGGFYWTGPGIISGASTLTPQVNLPGTYILYITNNGTGCVGTDTMIVTNNNIYPSVTADATQYLNCVQTSVTINSFCADTGIVYLWNPGGSTPNSSSTLVSSAGNYSLSVTFTATGCSSNAVVIVADTSVLPNVNPGLNQTLTCTIDTVILQGSTTSSNVVSIWNPAGTNPFSLINPVTFSGIYYLIITDTISGCSDSAAVVVNFDGSNCDELVFYNGLTPNGDGKNDVFYIGNIDQYPINTFKVYNRYGINIWEGINYDNSTVVFRGIDLNGDVLPPATYFFLLQTEGHLYKGWLELLR